MEYLTCPTCGFFIGLKSIEYNKLRDEICSNKNYSKEKINEEMIKVMKKMNIRRYCCRMRLMTCKDLSKEILAPE